MVSDLAFVDATYRELNTPSRHPAPRFEPDTIADLPSPAQRLLRRALPEGIELRSSLHLEMQGELKLGGRWFGFTARQFLAAGRGFVWEPRVGGHLLRFTGADAFGPSGASVDFRLFGRIPLVHASGPGVDHSAAGRLAAESVVWIPQALTPQLGAQWKAIDDRSASVTLDAAGWEVEVDVEVADDGRLISISLDRWNESATPPQLIRFGAAMQTEYATADGVRIAGSGTCGWHWHTSGEADGQFYRFCVERTSFAD